MINEFSSLPLLSQLSFQVPAGLTWMRLVYTRTATTLCAISGPGPAPVPYSRTVFLVLAQICSVPQFTCHFINRIILVMGFLL